MIYIEENTLNNIDCMEITDIDDNSTFYTKNVSYLNKSVRLTIDSLIKLQSCTKGAFSIYVVLLHELCNNTNIIHIDRKTLKSILNYSDSNISRGITELCKVGLIKIFNKDTYIIPIDTAYKGNLNKIIKKYKEIKNEEERIEKEIKERESITFLSNKRNNKVKTKSNGSKN